MLAWEVPEAELENIIQYIKTFSPKWQKERPGAPIVAPTDPWIGHEPAALLRGKELYHVTTQCSGCHPNYATKEEISAMTLRLKNFQLTGFRDDMYGSVLKESEYRTTLRPVDLPPKLEAQAKKAGRGAGDKRDSVKGEDGVQEPRYFQVSLLPPDFTSSEMRSGDTLADLFRTIAAGVGGTAMPSWKATAPYADPKTGEHWDGDNDIWALAHYVRSLVDLKGTKGADGLRSRLLNQPAWVAPPTTVEPVASPEPVAGAAVSAPPITPAPKKKH